MGRHSIFQKSVWYPPLRNQSISLYIIRYNNINIFTIQLKENPIQITIPRSIREHMLLHHRPEENIHPNRSLSKDLYINESQFHILISCYRVHKILINHLNILFIEVPNPKIAKILSFFFTRELILHKTPINHQIIAPKLLINTKKIYNYKYLKITLFIFINNN